MNESIELRNYKFDSDEIPLVSISCITYNHKQYIRDAIEGFLMQITNFPVEILIHDDASTDGTTEIIKEYEKRYPNLIKPLYEEENQWVKGRRGSIVFNIPRSQGKYIAFCEGDDYWTDPYKLQKQVDFLESHPDYGMVHTDADILYQSNKQIIKSSHRTKGLKLKSGDVFTDIIISRYPIHTCTVLLRKELLHPAIYQPSQNYISIDTYLFLIVSKMSNVRYFDFSTAVRRILDESLSKSANVTKRIKFAESGFKLLLDSAIKYKCNQAIIDKVYDNSSGLLLALYIEDKNSNGVKKYYKLYREHSQVKPKRRQRIAYYCAFLPKGLSLYEVATNLLRRILGKDHKKNVIGNTW